MDSIGLHLTSQRWGRCQVVSVYGKAGAGTAGVLDTGLRTALDSALLLIAANLAGAVLSDAAALDVLARIHRRAVLAGKVFLVVAPDPQARERMRISGLDRTLLVFPTIADFRAWNGNSGTQPGGGGALTCG